MIGNLAAKYDIDIELPKDPATDHDAPGAPMPRTLEPVSTPWRDFPRVVALSDFLKQHQEHGIQIVRRDNEVYMHFAPPLDREDQQRLEIAGQALELFAQAVNDIEFLMHRGLILIHDHPGYH
ncbi:hypothetical protein HNR65_002146 [Desulfosalsimonas propionicica]|uniref:Uncharacterized protein n=1 Tax=Desulfosalsimonas propionicica TaxID=332175 RepID=A0A7W0C9X8_9BACT|nr:hypothetical protein [Desulfosalsimonas propionicica]MBA2881815.1 hypothetical protein [Desulfosalsimonas propionicica]